METQFITCSFRLHEPSRRKQEIIDHIFKQYTLGMTDLLNLCQGNLELLEDWGRLVSKDKQIMNKYTEASILSVLPGSGRFDLSIASCLKESLLSNVASMLASYFELRKTDLPPGFPRARDPSPQGWPDALEYFGQVGPDLEDENESRHQLLNRAKGSVMPIHYTRSRDFRILADRNRERFFVWLQLLPTRHPLAEKLVIDQENLVDINTGEVFKRKGGTALLIPLEVGRRNDDWYWQYHNFLIPVIQGQARIKSAKLIRQENNGDSEYFLNVSFAFDCPDLYTPESYLGIDRGVFFSMAYGLVDSEGSIIGMGHKDDGFRHWRIAAGRRVQDRQAKGKPVTVKDYRQKHLDSILHALANDMIDLALKHKSMIVLEDLNIRIKGKFYKSAWKKMHKILEYKCKLAGVPIWKGGVWAAYSSQICIYCGELNPDRKRDGSAFTCPHCGVQYHSDEGAGVNIARRPLYRKEDWKNEGGYLAFHKSFANEATFLAKNDLRSSMAYVT